MMTLTTNFYAEFRNIRGKTITDYTEMSTVQNKIQFSLCDKSLNLV